MGQQDFHVEFDILQLIVITTLKSQDQIDSLSLARRRLVYHLIEAPFEDNCRELSSRVLSSDNKFRRSYRNANIFVLMILDCLPNNYLPLHSQHMVSPRQMIVMSEL